MKHSSSRRRRHSLPPILRFRHLNLLFLVALLQDCCCLALVGSWPVPRHSSSSSSRRTKYYSPRTDWGSPRHLVVDWPTAARRWGQKSVFSLQSRADGMDDFSPLRATKNSANTNSNNSNKKKNVPPQQRQVDLGIFGEKQPPTTTSSSRSSSSSPSRTQRVNGAQVVNKDTDSSKQQQPRTDGEAFGFVRNLVRRVRGKEDTGQPQPENGQQQRKGTNPTPMVQQGLLLLAKSVRAQNEQAVQQGKDKPGPSTKAARLGSRTSTVEQQQPQKSSQPTTQKDDSDDQTSSSSSWTSRFTSWISGTNNNNTTDPSNTSSSGSTNPWQKLWKQLDTTDKTEEWVTVFSTTRISPGELVPVTVAGIDLLVIASNDGKNRLYCIANSCPHLGTPLELGQLVRLPIEESSSSSSSSSSVSSDDPKITTKAFSTSDRTDLSWTERQVSSILQQDGCEDCIVCPLHKTAFALESGQVRGEWCPYPPIVGAMVGLVKPPAAAATFGVRVRGKDVQVRINTPISHDAD